MHYIAVSALLLRHHTHARVQDLLRRVNEEPLIGTVSYSDPATGLVRFIVYNHMLSCVNFFNNNLHNNKNFDFVTRRTLLVPNVFSDSNDSGWKNQVTEVWIVGNQCWFC